MRTMADSLAERIESLKPSQTVVGSAIEEALSASFERCAAQPTQIKGERSISKRGIKTIVFPCTDGAGYVRLVNDGKRFKREVVEKLPELGLVLGHKPGCEGYCMKGFRRNPRKTAMRGGKRETFPVRMVQCLGCRERWLIADLWEKSVSMVTRPSWSGMPWLPSGGIVSIWDQSWKLWLPLPLPTNPR